MEKSQYVAVLRLTMIILEAIEEAGELGAPSGLMYAALANRMSLTSYQGLMDKMQQQELVTVESFCYRMTEKGKQFLRNLQKSLAA